MRLKLLLLLLSFSVFSFAQSYSSQYKKQPNYDSKKRLEFGMIGVYQFGGKVWAIGYGELKLNDGGAFGLSAGIPLKKLTRLEFTFNNQNTKFATKDLIGGYTQHYLAVRYYQLGIVRELGLGPMIPYGSVSLGAVQVDPEINSEIWAFAMTLGGGLKYYFNQKIGLKIEARMLAPIEWGGLYLGIGTGGVDTGVSTNSTTVQGYIGGGITIAITK